MLPMTSPAEAVRKAIATCPNCPPTTTATLQGLLTPSHQANAKPTKTPPKATRTPATTTTTRTPALTKTTRTPALTKTTRTPALTKTTRTKPASGAATDATAALTPQDRYKLATDVVNLSLRVLNDAAKPTSTSRSQSPTTTKTPSAALTTVAECARIAFAHLRAVRSAKDPSLQLETGMLALSSKLLALGLDTLAMKELRILKTCLHRKSDAVGPSAAAEKETLASLLHLECRTSNLDLVSLAISYHLNVLRLVVNSGRPASVEASLPHLLLDNDISAASLILRSAQESQDKTKAVKQLDTLSKLVLSMCPSPSASADHAVQNHKTHAHPDIILKLQTIALRIQTKWWPLAGHTPDLQRELYDPLIRYLDAYKRRQSEAGPKSYDHAIRCLSLLVNLEPHKTDVGVPSALYSCLSALAEAFDMHDEALRWIKSMSPASGDVPDSGLTILCTLRSLIICLNRDGDLDLSTTRDQIRSCTSRLNENTNLTALAADEFLVELAKLRKVAIKLLTHVSEQQVDSESEARLFQLCEVVFLCTNTLGWYLRCVTRSETSENVASKLVVPFVSSNIFACKSLVSSCSHIESVRKALQVCTRLLDSNPDPDAEHLVVNISNLYWRCFQLSASSTEESSPQAIRCLQDSIDVLRDRAAIHQDAGFLAAKLEKFGSISKSCAAFAESLHMQLSSGILRDLAQDTVSKPLSMVLQTRSKGLALKRNLLEYHSAAVKDPESLSYFDSVSINALERATLFEIQLAFFEADLFKPSRRTRITRDLQQLCTRLLETYDLKGHPLRRARVSIRILKYSKQFPDLIDSDNIQAASASRIVHKSLGEDTGLEPYAEYLDISLSLAQGIHGDTTSVETVTELIQKLSALVRPLDSWDLILNKVDDVDILISELQFALAFLAMKGEEIFCLETLQTLSHIRHLQSAPEGSAVVQVTSKLALQYMRLGYSLDACRVLEKGAPLLSQANISTLALLEWHLARTEIYTVLGQADNAAESIAIATECMDVFPSVDNATKAQAQILRARFAFVSSIHSRSLGQAKQAMLHAKRYVMACQQTLSFLEQQHIPQGTPLPSNHSSSQEELVKAVDKLAISELDSKLTLEQTPAFVHGAVYSIIVPNLLNSFLHLADLYAHQGLRTEASYYLDQADALIVKVGAPELRTKVLVLRETQAYIEGIIADRSTDETNGLDSIDLAKLAITRGDIFAADEETWNDAQQEYEKAESMAARLASRSFVENSNAISTQPAKAPASKTVPARTTKQTMAKKSASKAALTKTTLPVSTKAKIASKASPPSQENLPLSSLCAAALRQRGLLLIDRGETDLGLELLKRADLMKYDSAQDILQQIAMAEGLLRKFGDELALDFTFNVLPESTISFPALSTANGKKSSTQTMNLSSPMSPITAIIPKKSSRQKRADDEFAQFLCEAQDRLVAVQRRSASTAGMSVFHQLCGLSTKAMLLLSAINANVSSSVTLHPTRAACSIEMARIEAFVRDLSTVEAEKEYNGQEVASQPASRVSNSHLTAARFQKEYIDIIPSSWTAVSLTLSEDHHELFIVRYRANQAPFLLRLPMTRNKMQGIEDDEESPSFDYQSGKAELQEIIELSNYSCSKPPSAMAQEAKQGWWDEREALDLRMQELVVNIENIWLGGFKGVLSQHRKDAALLARFRKSLDGILDRHLPSRQGNKSKSKKLVLDANIIELFVGLGDDHDGEIDMDEQVLDLLYFVIDILQFNGERNAYDEVDFDVIATETMDALRSYHEAANWNEADQDNLVLILDRKLHAFPWESLPCLQNVSVTRVGSILTLRERILAMRRQMGNGREEKYFVGKQSGASILNPSGDLSRTQTTMSPLLDSLAKPSGSSWHTVVNHVPKEKEFAAALSEKSTLLYFGHGSGNQYIRNRTIKKLDKCAEVVWLMGCSSGSVTEHGDYEPTSVPLSYLVAGKRSEDTSTSDGAKGQSNDQREGLCMAVVATLWDVTDKDIDRFSVKLGEQWGLWSSAASSNRDLAPPKTPRKRGRSVPKTPSKTPSRTPGGRSRSRLVKRDEEGDRTRNLAEAVMMSRDACNLRYLNGAATVVYGIPVYLGD